MVCTILGWYLPSGNFPDGTGRHIAGRIAIMIIDSAASHDCCSDHLDSNLPFHGTLFKEAVKGLKQLHPSERTYSISCVRWQRLAWGCALALCAGGRRAHWRHGSQWTRQAQGQSPADEVSSHGKAGNNLMEQRSRPFQTRIMMGSTYGIQTGYYSL
jgi:hypothetical protein